MAGAVAPFRGVASGSGGGSGGKSKSNAAGSSDADGDYLAAATTDTNGGGMCDVNELNAAFVRFNGLYSILFSTDLHLLHALFRAMVAATNRHSITLSLVRVIEHAGQLDAVVRAAASSEVRRHTRSCFSVACTRDVLLRCKAAATRRCCSAGGHWHSMS
jgi:hypothetical protein